MGATILQDLVVVMVLAAAVTILFYRLKQPVVLGYLLAGVLMGPHSSRFSLVKDQASINGLAELGIIFLMFAVGLEFNLKKLRQVGIAAALAAGVEVALMLVIGYATGQAMGWTPMDSIFLGAILSMSSTTIIVKILAEMGKIKEDYSQVVIGILIIEDLAAILLVAVLSSLGATGSFDLGVLAVAAGGILLFVFIFVAVGLVVVPRLIDSVSRFKVEEVLVITVVGLAFGAALLALDIGFSVTLGAFLMGAIVAESKAVRRVEHKIAPIRDLFTAVFFVAVGMLIDPALIVEHWVPILVITAVTIVGKLFATTAGAYLAGYDGRTAVKAGSALSQIGEFSFIIASLGLTLGVIRPELYPISVAVCAITSLTTPFLMRVGPAFADAVAPRLPSLVVRPLLAYTRGVRGLRTPTSEMLDRRDAHRQLHGTRVLIYAAWLLGLLIVAAYASEWLGAEVGTVLSLGDNAKRAAAVGFLGLASLPLFVAFTKATEAWTLAGAKVRAMHPDHLAKADVSFRRPRFIARAVTVVASIALVSLAVWIAWGVHPLGVPNTWLLVPVLMVVGFAGFFLWHRLEKVYLGMERTLNDLMGTEEELPEDRNHQLRERLPWGMDVEEVHINPHSRAAYQNLRSLNLRDRVGATVLSIERRHSVIPNPHPEIVLLPGDRLILVGKREQLTNAARHLHVSANERAAPMQQSEMRVPPSSPAVGKPLRALDLGETTGARVGLVMRNDGSMLAPSPRVELEPDDRLLVYGSEASLERARKRLRIENLPGTTRARRGPAR